MKEKVDQRRTNLPTGRPASDDSVMSYWSRLSDSNKKDDGPAFRSILLNGNNLQMQPNARTLKDGKAYRVYTPLDSKLSPGARTDMGSEPLINNSLSVNGGTCTYTVASAPRSRRKSSYITGSPWVTRGALTPKSRPEPQPTHYQGIRSANPVSPQNGTPGEFSPLLVRDYQSSQMSTWAAGFNVLNLFVGLGLLSKPYALQQGGVLILVGLLLMTLVANWSGKVIVRCFKSDQFRTSDQCTYLNLGKVAGGSWGKWSVIVTVTLEYIGASMIVVIFLWRNLSILTGWSDEIVVLASTLATLPTVWVLRFTELAWISLLGFVSTVLTTGVLAGVFIANQVDQQYVPESKFQMINWSGVPVGLGIFIVSLAGHAALPSVYAGMRHQKSFEKMLDWSFVMMFVIYSLMALAGYMVYMGDTDILVTTNLADKWPNNWICAAVTGFVVANCYCSVAPMFSVLAEIPEEMLNLRGRPWVQRAFRTLLLFITSGLAYLCINQLAIVEAITGSICTMLTSIILPGLFYCLLYWSSMRRCEKFNTVALIVFGFIMSVVLTYGDVVSIIDEYSPRPSPSPQ